MFEMAHLHEDSLREYDELELCYLETGLRRFLFRFNVVNQQLHHMSIYLFLLSSEDLFSLEIFSNKCPYWSSQEIFQVDCTLAAPLPNFLRLLCGVVILDLLPAVLESTMYSLSFS